MLYGAHILCFSIILLLLYFMIKICLKVLWLDNSIAFAIDQSLGDKNIPLTQFYFWPNIDAWEFIKFDLEKFNWISQQDAVLILNTITEIINLWQTKSDLISSKTTQLRSLFPDVFFIGVL